MFRKLLFVAATLLVGAVVLKFTNLDGYVKVYWDKLYQKIKKAPSLEDRVAKLKVDMGKLDEEMKARIGDEIRLDQTVKDLDKRLAPEKARLAKLEEEHRKLKTALAVAIQDKKTQITVDNDTIQVDDATRKLSALNTLLPTQRESVEKLQEEMKATRDTLDAVRKDLLQMQEDRERFKTLVTNLELRIKQLRQSERETPFGDRSRKDTLEADFSELDKDVAVAEQTRAKMKQYGLIEEKPKDKARAILSPEEVLKDAEKVGGK